MKILARFLLLFFLLFISMPTVVSLIKKNSDTSMFFCFTEEEHQKEIKAEIKFYFEPTTNNAFIEVEKKPAFFENNSEHPTVFKEIFSPPPNLS